MFVTQKIHVQMALVESPAHRINTNAIAIMDIQVLFMKI